MRVKLQEAVSCQDSLRWQLHRDYFQQRGTDAWVQPEVPYNVTSNPLFADQIAKILLKIPHSSQNPFQILELGSGLGVFALNLLQALEQHDSARLSGLTYWMTDYSRTTLTKVSEHPAFRQRIDQGLLRPLILDSLQPERGQDLAGQDIALLPGQFQVILANYHHCTLPSAQLYVSQGRWFELENELYGWLAGAPGQPSRPEERAMALQQLANRLMRLELSQAPPEAAGRLEKARIQLAARMRQPDVTQKWPPQFELRACLLGWLSEALSDPELEALAVTRLIEPLFSLNDFSQTRLEDVRRLKAFELRADLPDSESAQVLDELASELGTASISYPVQSLASLRRQLPLLAPEGCLLLTDKSWYAADELRGIHEPQLSYHGESLAQTVNFPFFERWFGHQNYACLWTQDPAGPVQTLLVSHQPEPLTETFADVFVTHNFNNTSQLLIEAGSLHTAQRQLPSALRCFLDALRLRPHDFVVLLNVIDTYRRLQLPEQAAAYLERPHDGYFHETFFAQLKADVYFSLARYGEALPNYLSVLAVQPGNGKLLYLSGLCLAALGRLQEALQQLEAAVAALPGRQDIQAALADLKSGGHAAHALEQELTRAQGARKAKTSIEQEIETA